MQKLVSVKRLLHLSWLLWLDRPKSFLGILSMLLPVGEEADELFTKGLLAFGGGGFFKLKLLLAYLLVQVHHFQQNGLEALNRDHTVR
jgi:hypothetical protein